MPELKQNISFSSPSSILATEFFEEMISPLHNAHIPSLENHTGTEEEKTFQKIPQRTKTGQKLYFCKGCCQHRKCLKILAQWTTMERLQQPFQSANCFREGPD